MAIASPISASVRPWRLTPVSTLRWIPSAAPDSAAARRAARIATVACREVTRSALASATGRTRRMAEAFEEGARDALVTAGEDAAGAVELLDAGSAEGDAVLEAGPHRVAWDGRDAGGRDRRFADELLAAIERQIESRLQYDVDVSSLKLSSSPH